MKSTRMTFLPTSSPIVTGVACPELVEGVFTKPDGDAISTYGVPFCAVFSCRLSWPAQDGAKRKASPMPSRPTSVIPMAYTAFILIRFLEKELFDLGDVEVSAIENRYLQFLFVSESYREAEDQKKDSYGPLEISAGIRKWRHGAYEPLADEPDEKERERKPQRIGKQVERSQCKTHGKHRSEDDEIRRRACREDGPERCTDERIAPEPFFPVTGAHERIRARGKFRKAGNLFPERREQEGKTEYADNASRKVGPHVRRHHDKRC